ncbi:MAG: hypothetical protein QG660_2323, partial [Pseudomonadota bacterium]|nr:hypothetical protein [Pseudomonadota bacterium]
MGDNSNGWVTEQNVYNGSGTRTQRTLHTGYDGVGNNTNYQVSVYTGTNYTNYYATTYAKFDGYKESKVAGTSTYFGAGATTTSYDQNGNITAVSETFATSKNRTFVTDQSGHILQKTENGKTQNYFYANDKPLGDSGALGGADFDYNYTPVSDQFPGNVTGNYVVSAGDTLRGIALAMFGDAQLWYLIADANGLKSDADLRVGLNLVMPNKVTNLRNAHDTFKPYEPGKIIGDTTPTLPNPPPPPAPKKKGKKGCGGVGAIVVAVVAIVATVITAGAAAVAMAGGSFAGVGVGQLASIGMAYMGSGTAFGMAAAAIGGAVGSIASQGVGMALGMQDKFSWSGVAMSAIGAAAGAAVGGVGSAVEKFVGSPVLGAIAQGVASSVLTQGIAVATGYQSKFSWTSVAAAAVGSGIGYGVARAASGIDNTVVRGTLSGLANGAAQAIVTGGRVNWGNVAADAFGNALGNSLAYQSNSSSNSPQVSALENAEREVSLQNVSREDEMARINGELDNELAGLNGRTTASPSVPAPYRSTGSSNDRSFISDPYVVSRNSQGGYAYSSGAETYPVDLSDPVETRALPPLVASTASSDSISNKYENEIQLIKGVGLNTYKFGAGVAGYFGDMAYETFAMAGDTTRVIGAFGKSLFTG